jgi:2-polyprenyl-6-hydroxyphenyl methylase/3-demethylubiquinone-9 3-methyltransferase
VTARYEAAVAARFDLLHHRFKREVAAGDFRLCALLERLEPVRGRRVLDLGCGKGRFAAHLAAAGAAVVGLDVSAAMLAPAAGLARVRGSARRLPFGAAAFQAVVAVEVFEHLAAVDVVLREVRRVLAPGGALVIIDKNAGALDARRPWLPGLAVKWIDQRRGRWMYPSDSRLRERWFWPAQFRRRMRRWFVDVRVAHLLSPIEQGSRLFRHVPGLRLMTVWSARAPGGAHD